jgi:hypothetical protein
MVMKPGIPKKETEIWDALLPFDFQANPALYQKQQHTPIERTTKNASSNHFFQTLENSNAARLLFSSAARAAVHPRHPFLPNGRQGKA